MKTPSEIVIEVNELINNKNFGFSSITPLLPNMIILNLNKYDDFCSCSNCGSIYCKYGNYCVWEPFIDNQIKITFDYYCDECLLN